LRIVKRSKRTSRETTKDRPEGAAIRLHFSAWATQDLPQETRVRSSLRAVAAPGDLAATVLPHSTEHELTTFGDLELRWLIRFATPQ